MLFTKYHHDVGHVLQKCISGSQGSLEGGVYLRSRDRLNYVEIPEGSLHAVFTLTGGIIAGRNEAKLRGLVMMAQILQKMAPHGSSDTIFGQDLEIFLEACRAIYPCKTDFIPVNSLYAGLFSTSIVAEALNFATSAKSQADSKIHHCKARLMAIMMSKRGKGQSVGMETGTEFECPCGMVVTLSSTSSHYISASSCNKIEEFCGKYIIT